jgi:uridine kinase
MKPVRIQIDGQTLTVQAGMSIEGILGATYVQEHAVVGAVLDNHLVGLGTQVDGDARLRPVTADSPEGQTIARRASALLFYAAMRARYPEARAAVGQSLLGGYFYEVQCPADAPPDLDEMALELTLLIDAMSAEARPIETGTVPVEATPQVVSNFSEARARLVEAWVAPSVPVVRLDDYVDIAHGPYPPSTAAASGTQVVAYPPGLLLLFPGAKAPEEPDAGRVVYRAYRETRDWNRLVGVATVGDVNRAALEDRFGELVRVAEALHEKKISEIADRVAQGARFVCVAGPSSSGKTTFVQRLSVQLRVIGRRPVTVGLDDYYRDRDALTPMPDGELDLEDLHALDMPLLQRHLVALARGETVEVPRFDFQMQRRAPPDPRRRLQLGPEDVLLIEGIHGLNPQLTDALPADLLFRVFVSAMTQLVLDERTRLTTTETRLLRRLVRDRRYRNTRAADTIARWPSVRRGEERHIFPYQGLADVVFNSALAYEQSVLRTFAWRYLIEVPRSHPSRMVAHQLLKLLELFIPVFPDDVPRNSVLREFIGDSGFRY